MKALILLADGFEDLEFFYPFYRLLEHGIFVDVAGPSVGMVVGKHGYTAHIDRPFTSLTTTEYEILILPGGKAPETIRLSPAAQEVTRKMLNSDKIVASICHGAQTLISADLLKGRKCTSWKGISDDIKAAGAHYIDQEVVVDRNLITSRRPDDLPAFCREIFAALELHVSQHA